MGRKADQMSDRYCKPTCPDVDSAFDDLEEALKDLIAPSLLEDLRLLITSCQKSVKDYGTLKLRGALVEACERIEELETELEDAQYEIRKLESAAA